MNATEVLQDMAEINNAYQDIEDALSKRTVDIRAIEEANRRIGEITAKYAD